MLIVIQALLVALGLVVALVLLAGVLIWLDVLDDRKGSLGRTVRDGAGDMVLDWIGRRLGDGHNDTDGHTDGDGDASDD